MANTSHYGFKLFEGSDHPSWLTDWNNTVTAIDNAIYRIATGGGDLPDLTEIITRLQAVEGRLDSDELRLNVVEGDIVDILSDLSTVSSDLSALATRVTTAESDIDALETTVNTTLPSQIQSINDSITGILSSISSMTSDISGIDTRVTSAEGNINANTLAISGLDTRLTTAEGNISTNSTNIATNSTDISGLDTRVTALEGAGGSSEIHEIFFSQSSQQETPFSYPIRTQFIDYNHETGSYFKVINNFDELVDHLTNNGKHTLLFFIYYMSDQSATPYTYKNVSVQVIPTVYFRSPSYKRYLNLDHFTVNATNFTVKGSTASSSYNQYFIYAM